MPELAHDLACRLARSAEDVCRHYLSNGRREGRYWLVGDVENTPGRSLFVRLLGPESGRGAAGKWTDAATGEHGDLLDLIAANQHLVDLCDTLDEARRFLALPRADRERDRLLPAPTGSPEAARRLFAMAKPIQGTIAEAYLRNRGITDVRKCTALRFHPHCFYRADADDGPDVRGAWPALIAAVTDPAGTIVGAHRTWLNPVTLEKAPVATPRRAMGQLLGHGVRFGRADDVLAVGEGIESMLSLRQIAATFPAIACLSAAHLAVLMLPSTLRHLYIAREDDAAGRHAAETLADRAKALGIEPLMLDAQGGDLNDDLRQLGPDQLKAKLRVQLAAEHVERFLAG